MKYLYKIRYYTDTSRVRRVMLAGFDEVVKLMRSLDSREFERLIERAQTRGRFPNLCGKFGVWNFDLGRVPETRERLLAEIGVLQLFIDDLVGKMDTMRNIGWFVTIDSDNDFVCVVDGIDLTQRNYYLGKTACGDDLRALIERARHGVYGSEHGKDAAKRLLDAFDKRVRDFVNLRAVTVRCGNWSIKLAERT